jgi:hypothetical protein
MKTAFYITVVVLVVAVVGFIIFYSTATSTRDRLTDELASANEKVSSLEQENSLLNDIITPSKPTHDLSSDDFNVSSTYWNLAWEGREAELQKTVREVNIAYYEWHTYIEGETDCNDMAVDIWDMLRRKGIISLLAIGNLELDDEHFDQCNHTWLVILNSSGGAFALEPTNGELYFVGDTNYAQYKRFFIYAKPSDMRADLGSRW